MEVREDKEIVWWSLGQKWFPSTQGVRVSSRERRFSKTEGKYMRVGVEVGRIEGGAASPLFLQWARWAHPLGLRGRKWGVLDV